MVTTQLTFLIVWHSDVATIIELSHNFPITTLVMLFLSLVLQLLVMHKIDTNIFRKEVMDNTTLRVNLCHPLHTLKAIPINKLNRAKRKSSTSVFFEQKYKAVCVRLGEHKYPFWMFKGAALRMSSVIRDQLLISNKTKKYAGTKPHLVVFFNVYQ